MKKVEFKQKKWLKPYIDSNTDLGAEAGNKFQVNICEKMNNNLSGKFVADIRKIPVTARTVHECVEIQSKITYDHYEQYET